MKRPWLVVLVAALCAVTATTAAAASSNARGGNKGSVTGTTIPDNTPGFIKKAMDNGAADPSRVIDVQVWLKLHNGNKLDQLVNQQRTRHSPNYHKWLSQSQFNATYAPTSQEVNAVTHFLAAHGITVTSVAENNFYVDVSGPISAIEKTFHVQIDTYTYDGQTYYSNTADPSINGSPGGLVAAVTGMDDYGYHPNVAAPAGTAPSLTPFDITFPISSFSETHCFTGVESHMFVGATALAGFSTYMGNRYGAPITNTDVGHLPPCGYGPSQIKDAYGLSGYGNDAGAGQTIVITDAFGSPTIQQDLAAFDEIYGLPAADLTVYRAPGVWHNRSPVLGAAGWASETTLDVEWAHAIAPGAKIALVVGPTDAGSLDEAINWAVVHHLGNVISNSWSTLEGLGNPAQFNRDNRILEQAAAEGIDVNFATGDEGDNAGFIGFKTVDFPASSPYATAVGGTSLALDGFDDSTPGQPQQTGWGTNLTKIASADGTPTIPPASLGFQFGAGGGTSMYYARPSWQPASVGSTMRSLPDISMDADPYTGAEIIETIGGVQYFEVYGGTSLATPLFSAVMAIASQQAGQGLGQAAPLLYNLPAGAVNDVQPVTSDTNVTGATHVGSTTTSYSADDLATPDPAVTQYFSAFYNSPFSGNWFTITFGTDSSLPVTTGWDPVTGLGTPNGSTFVNDMAAAVASP